MGTMRIRASAVTESEKLNLKSILKVRAGSILDWENSEYVPLLSEPCYASDSKILKFGDGIHTWAELQSISVSEEIEEHLDSLLDSFSEKLPTTSLIKLATALQPYIKQGMLTANSEAEMEAIAANKSNLGQVIKYVGITGAFNQDSFYLVEEDE